MNSFFYNIQVSENKEMQEKMKETDSFCFLSWIYFVRGGIAQVSANDFCIPLSTTNIQLWHEKLQFYCSEHENSRIICKVSLFFMLLLGISSCWWDSVLFCFINKTHTNPTSDNFHLPCKISLLDFWQHKHFLVEYANMQRISRNMNNQIWFCK